MVVVSFEDELEVNAVFAALDDRLQAQGRQLVALRQHDASASRDFAIECVQAAIRHAMRAKLQILAAVGEQDEHEGTPVGCCGADESTPHFTTCIALRAAWAPGEITEAYGR